MNKKRITIVCASDEKYSVMLAVMLKSLEINHKSEEKIVAYVLDGGISRENKKKIKKSLDRNKIKLVWKKVRERVIKKLKTRTDNIFKTAHYYRILAPYILPRKEKRIIYLDADVILLEDISKLWGVDLEGHILGAVKDPWVRSVAEGIPNYKSLGLDPYSLYFNSGVLLIDLRRLREEELSRKIVDICITNKKFVKFWDQYGMNVALCNRWRQLENKWNRFIGDDPEGKNSCIVHYLAKKPIHEGYDKKRAELFVKYLRKTQFKP